MCGFIPRSENRCRPQNANSGSVPTVPIRVGDNLIVAAAGAPPREQQVSARSPLSRASEGRLSVPVLVSCRSRSNAITVWGARRKARLPPLGIGPEYSPSLRHQDRRPVARSPAPAANRTMTVIPCQARA